MYGRLFTLVNADDHSQVFAWGMEITDEDRTDAVVYRSDPETRQGMFGLHASARAARRRYSRIHPLEVIWEAELDEADLSEQIRQDGQGAGVGQGHPRP